MKPSALRKPGNPAGTAKAAAALARFANGQLGTGDYDKRVAAVLGKQPGAQQTAKRLVQALETMAPVDRGKAFPGVAKLETLTTNTFDRLTYQKYVDQWNIPPVLRTCSTPF